MKSKQVHIASKNSKTSLIRRSPLVLTAELLILVLLLVTASYAPQVVFQIQDSFLCDRTALDQREGMDVESLSITYEKSLVQRMKVFAEGLMSEVNYYVTSKNLTINQEIYDYLDSQEGLQQFVMQVFTESGFISYSFYEMYYVNEWKQYVICSDNYAEGVNFILWYIELMDNQGIVLKLLMDAETGTFYAFKTENNDYTEKMYHHNQGMEMSIMWWSFFANYYEVYSQNDVDAMYKNLQELLFQNRAVIIDGYVYPEQSQYDYTPREAELFISDNAGFRQKENSIVFYLPYEEAALEVCILLEAETSVDGYYYCYYIYPNMTIGVRQIYELIPEFA